MTKNQIDVLNGGFVRLVDSMGDDSSIVQAARVSYGKGTKKVSNDKNLIRYLVRNSHSTPLEMVTLKFHVKAPIFVLRQWMRHRTWCLSGDTEIWFDVPSRVHLNQKGVQKVKLKDLYQRWNIPRKDNKKGQNQYCLTKKYLRCLNEKTKEIIHTHINDITQSGVKNIFELELENGYKIKTSENHLFYTEHGWKKLNEFVVIKDTEVKRWEDISLWSNGTPFYQDKEWLYQKYWDEKQKISDIATEANISSHTIRKWLKKFNLQDTFFQRNIGSVPWNKNKKYKLNLTDTQRNLRRNNMIKNARRGSQSNFWKGGITTERANIARWTREQSQRCFRKYNFKCVITDKNERLNAHHLDPVWNNPDQALNFDNLICLNEDVHKKIHSLNLELEFRDWILQKKDPKIFFEYNNIKITPTDKKEKFKWGGVYLKGKLQKIKRITYVGKEMTYDISVDGPYHNFIADGFVVHNSFNEISARYSELPEDFYCPLEEHVTFQNPDNKQGGTSEVITPLNMQNPNEWFDLIEPKDMCDFWSWHPIFSEDQKLIYSQYKRLLDSGMRKELARINLPVSIYSEMYACIDLHNLFHFLKLRLDSHAQYEIRVYAEAIFSLIKTIAPIACEAFEEYTLNSVKFSSKEIDALRELMTTDISSKDVAKKHLKNKREQTEFLEKLKHHRLVNN